MNADLIDLLPHDYQSALELLYSRVNYEKSTSSIAYTEQHYRLDRMRALLGELDDPQFSYPIIHIAGTKGKGTTATLLYDALRANGLRTGLYTSPHLVRLEERFRFDGQDCSQFDLVALARQAIEAANKIEGRGLGRPTFFEVTTAMGLLHFAQLKADCVVLEVGLGGRLDSTNVCTPILSIITSIGLDHQSQLGYTIEAIANEKAGIIKPGVPVVSTALEPDARRVIQRVARQQNAPLMLIDRDFSASWQPKSHAFASEASKGLFEGGLVHFQCLRDNVNRLWSTRTWQTRMLGCHQADNLAGVLAALLWLSKITDWKLDLAKTQAAIAASHPIARLQIVDRNPIQIIDTAHNPASITAALRGLDDHFGRCPRVVVFGCSRDKDYRSMLGQILPQCEHLICTNFLKNPRALECSALGDVAKELSTSIGAKGPRTIEIRNDPQEAWRHAIRICGHDGLVIAMGSFFLAAELLPAYQTDG